MTIAGSVSQLIAQAKDGDEQAFATLHRRYLPQIVSIASSRLNGAPPMPADADDVAQRAFFDLHLNFKNSCVPKMVTRHQFLALMSHIVACKVLNEIRYGTAQRRGGGEVKTISIRELLTVDSRSGPLRNAVLNDCYEYYVNGLPQNLRELADMHLAGMTNADIAERTGCVQRTVERKIGLLRIRWQEMAEAELAIKSADR